MLVCVIATYPCAVATERSSVTHKRVDSNRVDPPVREPETTELVDRH